MNRLDALRAKFDHYLQRIRRSRLFGGVGANAYGQLVTIAIQFASVPLLLSAWGAPKYGLWLVFTAIPTYMGLIDLGFSSAATNDMTLANARGEREKALTIYHSIMALNGVVAAFLIVTVTIFIRLAPANLLPETQLIGDREIRMVLFLMTAHVAASISSGGLLGGYTASGNYSIGWFLNNTGRLLESVGLVVGAIVYDDFVHPAAIMLVIQVCMLAGMTFILRRLAPWIKPGFKGARRTELRRLVGPALATCAQPLAFAISLQGFILVVGAVLSLDAVATFSTVRTLTRSVIQASGIVNHAIMPEVTRAYGASDFQRLHRLIHLNAASVITLNIVALIGVAAVGPQIIGWWTAGHVEASFLLVIGLGVIGCLHAYWLSRANLILAVNKHVGYSFWFLIVAVASVVLAVPCLKLIGLTGVLPPLFLGELAMSIIVTKLFRTTFHVSAFFYPVPAATYLASFEEETGK